MIWPGLVGLGEVIVFALQFADFEVLPGKVSIVGMHIDPLPCITLDVRGESCCKYRVTSKRFVVSFTGTVSTTSWSHEYAWLCRRIRALQSYQAASYE
jgi:hypothetical protein